MSRYEPGFERQNKSDVVGSHVHRGIPSGQPEAAFSDATRPNEGLSNKILASLPAPEFKRLVRFFEPVALTKGKDLDWSEADAFVYFPESAVISHLYGLKNGGATGAAVIGNEGVVGLSMLFASRAPIYFARVMIEGEGLRVKAEVIKEEFARGENLQRLVLAYMSKRLTQVSQRAVCNGRHKLLARLCTWLLMIDDRAGGRSLELTHGDIGDHLGARRSVISGVCNDLRTRGMIAYTRGHIVILDRNKLELAACECYQVLKP